MSISDFFNEFLLEADLDVNSAPPDQISAEGAPQPKRKRTNKRRNLIKTMADGSKVLNMSRRVEGSILCAFPAFDRCDSLLFFPHSFSRYVNSADGLGMKHLLLTHTSKKCDVFFAGHNFYVPGFLRLLDLSIDLHPDTVSCVRVTKVVNNTVQAKFFSKFSECEGIFESVGTARSNDPLFRFFYSHLSKTHKRSERYRPKIDPLYTKTDEEKVKLIEICDTPGDLMVYATFYLTLTFDDATRKITRIDYTFEVTSIIAHNTTEMAKQDALQLLG